MFGIHIHAPAHVHAFDILETPYHMTIIRGKWGGEGARLWAAMESSTLMGSSTKREGCTILQWVKTAAIIYTNYDDDREGFRLVRTPMYSKHNS